MRFSPVKPPRVFPVGLGRSIRMKDCARIKLEADEQVTFTAPSGAEYDVARKSWGYYATPSMNGRLKGFGLRAVLVRNGFGKLYLMLVEKGKEAGFRAYVMAIPFFILLLMAISWVLSSFRIQAPPQPIFTLYLSEQRTAVVRVLLLLAVVTGPVAEELFFRGFLYGWLRQRLGVARGLLLSAFLFAILHMDPVAFLPILGLGLLFGWVYERTGSLAAPIAVHVFHNGGMLFIASVIKGLIASP